MALGTITLNKETGGRPSAPIYALDISFAGDGAYPTGGTASFSSLVQAAAKAATPALNVSIDKANIMGLLPIDLKGYQLAFDKSADKLIVYHGDNNNASDGPGVEVPNTTDLSAVTFRVTVVFQ